MTTVKRCEFYIQAILDEINKLLEKETYILSYTHSYTYGIYQIGNLSKPMDCFTYGKPTIENFKTIFRELQILYLGLAIGKDINIK